MLRLLWGKRRRELPALQKTFGKPVLAFAGAVTRDAAACNNAGIDAFFPILRSVVSLEEAMDPKTAASNMVDTAEQVFRVMRAVGVRGH